MRKPQSARRRERRDAKRKHKSAATKEKNRLREFEARSPMSILPWRKS